MTTANRKPELVAYLSYLDNQIAQEQDRITQSKPGEQQLPYHAADIVLDRWKHLLSEKYIVEKQIRQTKGGVSHGKRY